MTVSDVRKKYPEFFVEIEAAVWDDTGNVEKNHFITTKARRRIAYNAAAVAVLELHKRMRIISEITKAIDREVKTVKNSSSPMNLSVITKWIKDIRERIQ